MYQISFKRLKINKKGYTRQFKIMEDSLVQMIYIEPFLRNFQCFAKRCAKKIDVYLICAIALMPIASASDIILYSNKTSQSYKIPTEVS